MQTRNRVLDDMARVASGALGVASSMRGEVEARLRAQFDRLLGEMDLVTREEFDAVKALAARAREEQEALAERLAALEARLAALEAGGAKAPAKKPAARKAAAKPAGGKPGAPKS